MVVAKLARIGAGFWGRDGTASMLVPEDAALKPTLELWRVKFSKSGRVLFEVAPDYSSRRKCYVDMIRIWAITTDHSKYEREHLKCEASHRRSQSAREKPALRRLACAPLNDGQRLPQTYEETARSGVAAEPPGADAPPQPAALREMRDHFPPANASVDTFTLLKFFDLTPELVHACLAGADESRVDFPFRVSPVEAAIIAKQPQPAAAMLLVGRSGTGKTTCIVYRLWTRWLQAHQAGMPLAALFVTASATLRQQVQASFRRLRAATYADRGEEAAVAAAEEAPLTSLLAVSPHRWPLFLTSGEYLGLLDKTLPEPFLTQGGAADGDDDDDDDDFDMDGAEVEIDLRTTAAGSNTDSDDEELDAFAGNAALAPRAGSCRRDARKEVTFTYYSQSMWQRITTREQRDAFSPALVFQEIRSFLAGSAGALASPKHRLSLESYLEVGRKRAPNFTEAGRIAVYPIFLQYVALKAQLGRYDVNDLVASIYSRINEHGWRGVPIQMLFRDEVQDFSQAELLLDLRVLPDPSGILFAGDTAQTIARGVAFRFADIRTLFYDESLRRAAASTPGPPLAVPAIDSLQLNYRTHAGILDAAAVCVASLRVLFPLSVDALPRERAFFDGQRPLIFPTLSENDFSILLSGGDRGASAVEFGAHRVILVRNTEAAARLPLAVRSTALIMTISQAKARLACVRLPKSETADANACPLTGIRV
jgi:hypothetical protein